MEELLSALADFPETDSVREIREILESACN
jgi:hypothetical protein